MSTQLTPKRWQSAPWHARQEYLAELDRQRRDLETAITHMRGTVKHTLTVAGAPDPNVAVTAWSRATALLAGMDSDPDAAAHRAQLLEALVGFRTPRRGSRKAAA